MWSPSGWVKIDAPLLSKVSISSDGKIAGIGSGGNILYNALNGRVNEWKRIQGNFIYVDISQNYIVANKNDYSVWYVLL